QVDGTGGPVPRWHHHVAAARPGAGVDGPRDGRARVLARPRPVLRDRTLARGERRRHHVRQDRVHLRPGGVLRRRPWVEEDEGEEEPGHGWTSTRTGERHARA